MNWIEVSIKTASDGIEEVTGVLYELDITGLVIEDTKDIINLIQNDAKFWDYVDEDLIKSESSEAYIKFYIPDDIQGKEKLALVTNAIVKLKETENEINLGTLEIMLDSVAEEDWANNWKKYYKPVRIGQNIIIKPTWEEYIPKQDDLIIEIDPGMAFGTGTHETTSMCIELIEKYIKQDDIMLDIGCGSGILSIVGAKLGAKKIIGVDFDSVAVEVAKNNVTNNNLNDKVEIRCGNLTNVISEKGNIIVANIIADVIIKLLNDLPQFSFNNSIFITSGIIKERLEDVKNAVLNGPFEILEINSNKEWVSLAIKIKE